MDKQVEERVQRLERVVKDTIWRIDRITDARRGLNPDSTSGRRVVDDPNCAAEQFLRGLSPSREALNREADLRELNACLRRARELLDVFDISG